MPEEVVTVHSRGIDIVRACLEIIQSNSPSGDRNKIDNIKQVVHQQALATGEAEDLVAMKLLLSAFKAYVDATKSKSSLEIVSSVIVTQKGNA